MEIERKYLVHPAKFDREAIATQAGTVARIQQGYFTVKEKVSVRVRLVTLNKNRCGTVFDFDDEWEGLITLKTKEAGIVRQECEGSAQFKDTKIFFELCANKIMKDRFTIYTDDVIWMIDDFGPPHEELIIAEVELPNIDTKFKKPEWLGEEVTTHREFYSENLNTRKYIPKLEAFLGWKIPK